MWRRSATKLITVITIIIVIIIIYHHHHHYHHQHQVMSRASVAKECYEAHRQPWEAEQLEEESMKKVKTSFADLTIL